MEFYGLYIQDELNRISASWDWDNLEEHWSILEGAYCRLSWVVDGVKNTDLPDEYKDILDETLEIIEVLQLLEKD